MKNTNFNFYVTRPYILPIEMSPFKVDNRFFSNLSSHLSSDSTVKGVYNNCKNEGLNFDEKDKFISANSDRLIPIGKGDFKDVIKGGKEGFKRYREVMGIHG
jgi:hypothetical protein